MKNFLTVTLPNSKSCEFVKEMFESRLNSTLYSNTILRDKVNIIKDDDITLRIEVVDGIEIEAMQVIIGKVFNVLVSNDDMRY